MDYEKVLEHLNTSAIKLMETQSLEALAATIVNEARTLVDANHGSIFLERDAKLERIYTSSPILYNAKIRRNGYTEKAFKHKTITVIQGKRLENINPKVADMQVKSLVMIPLAHRTQAIGVLSMYFQNEGSLSPKDMHILKLYSSMASLAITRTRLHEATTRAVELRDRFISLASHELRTPLTSINGYIQLLHSKLADKNTIESRWIKELLHESNRMTNLVKDLLDVNRIKQGQLALVFSEVSMTHVIESVITKYQTLNPERVFYFKNTVTEPEDTVIGDNEKLQDMVSAFVGNAIKFSKPPSKITIMQTYKNKSVSIKIIDEGKGIPQQDLENIFGGFYKTKHSREKEGMGIGLLLAKHIIQLHKGKINITSEELKGTTIQVDLPTAKI